MFTPNESLVAQSEDADGLGLAHTQQPSVLHHLDRNRSLSRRMLGILKMIAEVWRGRFFAMRDDECETVKGLSDDGYSYAGTVVRGVLRGDSE